MNVTIIFNVYNPSRSCDFDHSSVCSPVVCEHLQATWSVRLWLWSATLGETVTVIMSTTRMVSAPVLVTHRISESVTMITSTSHMVSATVTMISYPWWDCDHDQLPMVRLWPWSDLTHVVSETETMISYPWNQCDCDHDQLSMGSVRLWPRSGLQATWSVRLWPWSATHGEAVIMISYPWWDCDHDQICNPRGHWDSDHDQISSSAGQCDCDDNPV